MEIEVSVIQGCTEWINLPHITSMDIGIEIDYLEQFDVVETEEAAEDVVGK